MKSAVDLIQSMRRRLGVIVKEWFTYQRKLSSRDKSYLALCNRGERLSAAPDKQGYHCEWEWTSDLHAPKFIPTLGLQLVRRACADHPIVRSSEPPGLTSAPLITYLIGHRGASRIPLLMATIQSIAAQQRVSVECVVIEQDSQAKLSGLLPGWVRHIHTPPPDPNMAYCRSWAFNVGVRHARGRILVLHDNDMLISTDYSESLLSHYREGFEVINLKRFIFYLSEAHTERVLSGDAAIIDESASTIMQNGQAGGSIAITREAYDRIGGMDESFIGWGGEDNEFWERAQTLRVWPYAYLPLVHLWHPAQPGKHQADNPTLAHYRALSAIAPEERIRRLRAAASGQASGPAGWKVPG